MREGTVEHLPAEYDAVVDCAAAGGDDEDWRAGDERVQAHQGARVSAVVVLGLGEHGDRAGHPGYMSYDIRHLQSQDRQAIIKSVFLYATFLEGTTAQPLPMQVQISSISGLLTIMATTIILKSTF